VKYFKKENGNGEIWDWFKILAIPVVVAAFSFGTVAVKADRYEELKADLEQLTITLNGEIVRATSFDSSVDSQVKLVLENTNQRLANLEGRVDDIYNIVFSMANKK
tara:strand:+ start:94 stop:411 length:318 start_codon:yes stop_codon:yes gene_type:complete